MATAVVTKKLERGQPLKIVTAATGTGVGQSAVFACGNSLNASDNGTCTIAPGTQTGTFSALVGALEVSLDGGNTFAVVESALNLGSTSAPLAVVIQALVPGGIYQFTITTFTGGTTADVWIAANA